KVTPAGSLTDVAGGSISAGSLSRITSSEILRFIERLEIPLVLSFSLPKHDAKDEVSQFVGINCDKEVEKSRKVKSATNLVSLLTKDLCYTNVLRAGSPKVVVVPGQLITRHTKTAGRAGSVERNYQVALRADSSVSGIRETVSYGGAAAAVRVAIVNARGATLKSEVTSKESSMLYNFGNGAVRYEAASTIGNGKVTKATKTLYARGYKGLNLSITEDALTPDDVTCNVIAVDMKTAEVVLSEAIEGRCFHRE
ncbi:MAG: hypothetical protein AAB250_01340, partial [Bdellovibrionota bacterium]